MTPLAAKGLAPVLGIEPALVSAAPAALPVAPAALQVASTLIEQVASSLPSAAANFRVVFIWLLDRRDDWLLDRRDDWLLAASASPSTASASAPAICFWCLLPWLHQQQFRRGFGTSCCAFGNSMLLPLLSGLSNYN